MSRKINLNVDFKVDRTKEGFKEFPENKQGAFNYISYAVKLAYPQGLTDDKRRMWFRIENKIEQIVNGEENSIVLEEFDYVFLKGCFEKSVVPANDSKFFTLVEQEFLGAESIEEPK